MRLGGSGTYVSRAAQRYDQAGQGLRNTAGSIDPVVSTPSVTYGCAVVHFGWCANTSRNDTDRHA